MGTKRRNMKTKVRNAEMRCNSGRHFNSPSRPLLLSLPISPSPYPSPSLLSSPLLSPMHISDDST